MSAFYARREEDVAKLRSLEQRTAGRIKVVRVSGQPITEVELKFNVRTAADSSFPSRAINNVVATIKLGARYPLEEPSVSFSTKVFNPNVYSSGRVCLGLKWLPTEYLDLLAQRLFKLLAFDDSIVNTLSPANGEASRWYARQRAQHPSDFPSDRFPVQPEKPVPGLKWTDKSAQVKRETPDLRVIRDCPKCQKKMRVPSGKQGSVRCPGCSHIFQVST